MIAKGVVHDHKDAIQKLMLSLRQFGVAIPGGAEALIHFRKIAEDLMQTPGFGQILAALDIDLVNAFPSFEWHAIRESVAEFMPSILPWTQWCHKSAVTVRLPSGGMLHVDRGAEQGDP